MACVYVLHLKDAPKEYRYVGVTTRSAEERLYRHKKSSKYDKKYPIHLWIARHYDDVAFTILDDNLTLEEALDLEVKYIASYRKDGYKLLNATDGGDGITGYVFTEEARRAVSEGQRGRVHSAETRRKIAAAHTGKRLSEEHKRKIGEKSRGRIVSEETRKKMSEWQKGKPRNSHKKSEQEPK